VRRRKGLRAALVAIRAAEVEQRQAHSPQVAPLRPANGGIPGATI